MGFFGCIPRFLKANAGWVLTALGSVGLVGTVILVAKETPEVEDNMEVALVKKVNNAAKAIWLEDQERDQYEIMDQAWDTTDWTFWDKAKVAIPIYLPAILTGAGTLACFWGGQIFNAKKQAALVAAYGALVMQFDQYREVIKAEYGEEVDQKALAVSQAETKRLRGEIQKLKEESGPFLYTFATLPGVIFEERPEQIYNALMHFNRNCILKGGNTLDELYQFAGLPDGCYDKSEAEKYGWQGYENEVNWGVSYVDFALVPIKNNYGRMVYVIDSYVPPYEVGVDYGYEGNVENYLYSGYNPTEAKFYAEKLGNAEVIGISTDHLCYAPGV